MPLELDQRLLAPDLKRAILDSEARLHAVMQAHHERLQERLAEIQLRLETSQLATRVETLENRMRDLGALVRRALGD